jgi:D-alanyl-D-alanine carboxypeptidase
MTYQQFVTQNLIAPNGLSSTSVPVLATDQTLPPPFNPAYFYDHGVTTEVTQRNISHSVASGNIISTAADMARWISRLMRGEAGLNAASVEAMKAVTPQSGSSNYGLGISYATGLGYGHNGALGGYLSEMRYDPVTNVTTIVYFNLWDLAHLADQFALNVEAGVHAKAAVGY